MKLTNSQPRLDCSLETGWTIHIYNRQRKLLCTLNPSHGWSFATGTVIGLLLAVVGFNLSMPQISNSPVHELAPVTAPLQLD
jgi:hypothetical protein